MAIKENDVVSIAYEVKNEDGVVVDESTKDNPLQYIHGHDNLIPGLENALEGKEIGDIFEVTIAPEDAYGEYLESMVQRVPAEIFQTTEELTVGMRFLADTDQGPIPVEITAIEGDEVIVDGNHDLAGQTLSFHVEVIDVREATEDEIEHGHIHRAGGCCGGHDDEGCCGGHGHLEDENECCGGHEDGHGCGGSKKKKKEKEGCCGKCH